ncbi:MULTISPECIES: hypothetical protein [Methanosarcina]|nr:MULTISPECIES: hypothetical protein [Methanosarcina]
MSGWITYEWYKEVQKTEKTEKTKNIKRAADPDRILLIFLVYPAYCP